MSVSNNFYYFPENIWNDDKFGIDSNIIIVLDDIEYSLNREILSYSDTLRIMINSNFKEKYEEKIYLDNSIISKLGWEYSINFLYSKFYMTKYIVKIFPFLDDDGKREFEDAPKNIQQGMNLNIQQIVYLYKRLYIKRSYIKNYNYIEINRFIDFAGIEINDLKNIYITSDYLQIKNLTLITGDKIILFVKKILENTDIYNIPILTLILFYYQD